MTHTYADYTRDGAWIYQDPKTPRLQDNTAYWEINTGPAIIFTHVYIAASLMNALPH